MNSRVKHLCMRFCETNFCMNFCMNFNAKISYDKVVVVEY